MARVTPIETAVIVPVPAAEPVVGDHRATWDVAASRGVPAHVTVLYPFVAPTEVDDDLLARLSAAVATVPAFDCSLATAGWFDEDVLWLAPSPAEPFRDLTRAVWRAFPDHPPYAGRYDDLSPHLTVGLRGERDVSELRRVEAAVLPALPVSLRVDRAVLMAGAPEPDAWHPLVELPLG